MSRVLDVVWHGLRDAFLMAWEAWWALVFGFLISAVVQAWVPRERIEKALSGAGVRPIATATALGAASHPAPMRPSRSPRACSRRAPRQRPHSHFSF